MRILIIKPSSLGDIIHGLQVAAIIKKNLPDIVIDWVVREDWKNVVSSTTLVDKIFLFHRHGGIKKFYKLITEIRCNEYDVVLDMQGLARTGVLTFFSHSEKKIGRWDARELSWLAYNDIIDKPNEGNIHALDILLRFLPKLGVLPKFDQCLTFSLPKTLTSRFTGEYVLLFPESRRPEKQWPYFLTLAEKLADLYANLKIVIVGQKSIKSIFLQENVINLSGSTSILNVFELIQHCLLLVANDSAPIHIGASMRKPIIALFGPTDPKRFGPYPLHAKKHTILTCRNLSDLSVEQVLNSTVYNIDKFLHGV